MTYASRLPRLSRRGFLKALGLVSGGVLAEPAAAVIRAPTRRTVGVLVPQSRIYPSLSSSFAAGLRSGLGRSTVELIVEVAGTTPGVMVEKCRRLVHDIKPDLVVALANPAAIEDLAPLLDKGRIPLMLATAGANASVPDRRGVVVHSLECCRSNFALGIWAARNIGRRAMTAASMHDSGYDAHYAFQLGFEAAGGKVVAARVTDSPINPGGVRAFLSEVERVWPDVVFANYSGHDALPFVAAWAQHRGLRGRIPLVGSAFLVDENILPMMGAAAAGIHSVLPWAPSHDNAGQVRDVFRLLGQECGRSLAHWDASGRLTGVEPRTLCLRRVTPDSGVLRNEIVCAIEGGSEADERMTASFRGHMRTGWTNTYLSV